MLPSHGTNIGPNQIFRHREGKNSKGREVISGASHCRPDITSAAHYRHHEKMIPGFLEGVTEVEVVLPVPVLFALIEYPPLVTVGQWIARGEGEGR